MSTKKAAVHAGPRGSGHPNKILMTDYATGDVTFQVETEIRRTKANAKMFNALVKIVKKKIRAAKDNQAAVELAYALVDGLRTPALEARAAKAMFKAALMV